MVVVTNNSDRPVRDVASQIEVVEVDQTTRQRKAADVYGEIGKSMREPFKAQGRDRSMPVLRARHTAEFVWSFTAAQYPRLLLWVRFTDDAGLHWEIDTSLHLQQLKHRDWSLGNESGRAWPV